MSATPDDNASSTPHPSESATPVDSALAEAAADEAFLVQCDADVETRRSFEELQKTKGFIDRTNRDIETLEVTRRELQDMIAHADDYKDEYFHVGTFCEKVSDVWAERKESDWAPSSRKTVRLFPNASSIMEQKETSERLRRDRSLVDRAQLEMRHPQMFKRVTEDEERRKVFQAAMLERSKELNSCGRSNTRQMLIGLGGDGGASPINARGGVPKHLLSSADGSSVLCVDSPSKSHNTSSIANTTTTTTTNNNNNTSVAASYASLTPHSMRQAALTASSSRPGSRSKATPTKASDQRLPRLVGQQAPPRSNALASSANNYETSAIRATLGSAFAVNPTTRTPEVERAMLRAQEAARQRREERLRADEGEDDDAPELDATCRPDGTLECEIAALAVSNDDGQPSLPFDRDGGPSRGGLRLSHVKHDNLSRLLEEQRVEMDEMARRRTDEYEPVLGKYFEYHDTVQRKLDAIAKSGIMENPNERGVGSRRAAPEE